MQQWDADIQLSTAAAAALIWGQFPALADARLTLLGEGWDNLAFLLDDRLVFRFPRRQIAAELLVREARILPLLAPHLPLPIPSPAYVGTPTADYPYTFAGYPLIPGETACRRACDDAARVALAPALGHFLAALHGSPLDAATRAWAPLDEIVRANPSTRAPKVIERLRDNAAGLDATTVDALVARIEALKDTPLAPEGALRWVHGDFYARHLLLDDALMPTGVIDWGDVHLGDPAIDLSIAHSFLPPAGHRPFRDAYGAIDDATWRRARFRAIHYGALLSQYGRAVGDREIAAVGDDALRYALLAD